MKENREEGHGVAGQRRRRRYLLRYKLLLLLGAIGFSVLVAEAAARLLYQSDELEFVVDDELLWRLRPNQVVHFQVGRRTRLSSLQTVNRDGFRGSTEPVPGDGRVAVLALGDSYTYGSGVNDDETFCARLELLSNGRLAVVNAGVPGWGIFQEEILLTRVVDTVKPQYVLVTIVEGDILRQPFESEEKKESFLRQGRLRNSIRRFSTLATLIGRTLQRMKLAACGQAVPNALPSAKPTGAGPSDVYRSCWEADRQRLLAMRAVAEQQGATFVIVAWPQCSRDTAFFLSEVERLGKENAIVTINLAHALGKHDPAEWQIPDDGHPNPFGHQVVAEEILNVLFSRGPGVSDHPG